MIEPNSGNVVPPGAMPEEVKDDVPIQASEGEYVLPADVVRFLGLDKIEKMVAKAKEQLAGLDEKGRIGGDDPEDDEALPFDPSSLMAVEEEEAPQGFAEGGMVSNVTDGGGSVLPQDKGFSGVKMYKDKNGKSVFIPYMNGQPLFTPPKGFSEDSGELPTTPTTPVEPTAPKPQANQSLEAGPSEARPTPQSRLAGDPSDWQVNDFINYGKQKDDIGSKAIKGMIGFAIPGGGPLMKMRENMLDDRTAELFDTMLDTGKDLQGNTLTSQQVSELTSTRDRIKADMSQQSGLDLNPFGKLKDAVGAFTNFVTGTRKTPESMLTPKSSSTGSKPVNSTSSANFQSDAYKDAYGSWNTGSDNEQSGNYGPSQSTLDSSGRISTQSAPPSRPDGYGKGGLIKRRSKKC